MLIAKLLSLSHTGAHIFSAFRAILWSSDPLAFVKLIYDTYLLQAFSSTDGTEACVYVHGGGEEAQRGRWGDLPCPEKMPFVCQLPMSQATAAAIQVSV
jgi:hypothetical protein